MKRHLVERELTSEGPKRGGGARGKRRTVTVNTNTGRQQIVQEITDISPVYTRLQSRSVQWDMRIATSSIPSHTLRQVILQRGEHKGAEAHLDLVRILFLSERYQEAARELTTALKQYPQLEQDKLSRMNDQLVQQGAQRSNRGQASHAPHVLVLVPGLHQGPNSHAQPSC